ncbi:PREDICTED: protein DOWNSTREAM OF FLC [Theobroma cacao]|uniref:Protein DOWNSTREAM OF FLC n=1 Tax=Theobroma cacao TaxID=3641 RepID=A0AB32VNE2_THECC|nr:PREDICTED: protein DOWNSTREAM OF FLC [Theobroma cacao]
MATKLFLLLALCVLPVLVNARREPFRIVGKVYCDGCRAGFETSKCSYIPGATVEIKCYDRTTLSLKFSVEAVTDSTGTYDILVEDDHQDQICYATLVSSPIPSCRNADPRRNKATVILTRSNGVISNLHYANAMGFLQDEPEAGCQELLQKLLEDDA